jgi:hypothetical protein
MQPSTSRKKKEAYVLGPALPSPFFDGKRLRVYVAVPVEPSGDLLDQWGDIDHPLLPASRPTHVVFHGIRTAGKDRSAELTGSFLYFVRRVGTHDPPRGESFRIDVVAVPAAVDKTGPKEIGREDPFFDV